MIEYLKNNKMKAKIILTRHNIDYFFDLFDEEFYNYGKTKELAKITSNAKQKEEALDTLKHTQAILFLDIDTEEKLYTMYTKFIILKELIDFKELLINEGDI